MARWVIANGSANTAQVAAHFGKNYKITDDLLRQRANTVHDIRRGRGAWVACSPETRAVMQGTADRNAFGLPASQEQDDDGEVALRCPAVGSGSGVIAGLRQPPDRTAVWKGHATPGPIRPGAMDFMAIPSRHGDTRHPYTAGGPEIAAPAGESPARASLSHRNGPRPTV